MLITRNGFEFSSAVGLLLSPSRGKPEAFISTLSAGFKF
jgi:hypothetical protein